MSSYAEQLEERARSKFSKHGGDLHIIPSYDVFDNSLDPPDNIDDLYGALKEDPATAKRVMASISSQDAEWLAQYIQGKAFQEREEAEKEIERELEVREHFCVEFLELTRLVFRIFVLRGMYETFASCRSKTHIHRDIPFTAPHTSPRGVFVV